MQVDDAAPVGLEAWLRRHRPADAMTGWPFTRLLIGPAQGIARVENWKGPSKPGTRYECRGEFCQCDGVADCFRLAFSNNCNSPMTCTGDGTGVTCYCSAD